MRAAVTRFTVNFSGCEGFYRSNVEKFSQPENPSAKPRRQLMPGPEQLTTRVLLHGQTEQIGRWNHQKGWEVATVLRELPAAAFAIRADFSSLLPSRRRAW
jgi:hypothetical protein